MIKLHSKSTYQRIYNSYSAEFIDAFCTHKRNGHTTQEALTIAKIIVQSRVSLELTSKSRNKKLIIKAYTNLSSDSKLIEKAIQYYQGIK